MTNVEIEDVLSSIRRLVSEEDRPVPRGMLQDAPGKLVLTPALRIVPADVPDAEVADPADHEIMPPDAAVALEAALEAAPPATTVGVPEPSVLVQPQEWEHDGSEMSDAPQAWDPGATPEAAPLEWADEDRDSAGTAADEGLEEDLQPEGPMLDEEMLRDLVRDILREELHGALGERITRNVRKLVRAEINRALATRDFD